MYGSYIAWRRPDLPLPRLIDPRAAFERMFGARDEAGRPLPQPSRADDQEPARRGPGRRPRPAPPARPRRPAEARRVPGRRPRRGAAAGLLAARRQRLAAADQARPPDPAAGDGPARRCSSPARTTGATARPRADGQGDRPARAGPADARPDRPGVLDRHHAERHLPVRQRRVAAELLVPGRRQGEPPLLVAPRQQAGEDRRVQEDHPLARRAVRLPARPAQGRSRKGSGPCWTTR